MKRNFFLFFISFFLYFDFLESSERLQNPIPQSNNKLVLATKKIDLSIFPNAYNPSITKFNDHYLLAFRYLPSRSTHPWLSYMGVVLLNEAFDPISSPVLLDTRFNYPATSSQSEDPRIINYDGRIYIIYNDNREVTFPTYSDRRDMYIAELIYAAPQFILSDPIKLLHETQYSKVLWQKNWSPFIWKDHLLLSYSITPHEVISADLTKGICQQLHKTQNLVSWKWGPMHGGTPAVLVDNEYLAFFHSALLIDSPVSNQKAMWHYFMGAYTFSAEPPFSLTKMSSHPINTTGFYTSSNAEKRVIYPGGFVIQDSLAYVAFGNDDCEIWIATIDLNELKNSMVPLK